MTNVNTKEIEEAAAEATATFQVIETAAVEMDEISTFALSELYEVARDTDAQFEDFYKTQTAPLQATIREAQAKAKAARTSAKQTLAILKEGLDACYEAERTFIEDTKREAMETGNHDLLADLPEAPAMSPGVAFAETRTAKVVDLEKIPEEFIIKSVDTKALTAALKEGRVVPGATLIIERTWKRIQAKGE